MLTDWDVSIEEVPFYLADQFGVISVQNAILELRAIQTDMDKLATLKVIDYWLKKYEEAQEEKKK
jgi:hypothetical protein